jgi:predicted Zn-dependent peptidase
MRVATAILQGLVFQEIRVRRQLSYAPGADLKNLAANTGNITVSSPDANQSVQVMLEQIEGLRTRTLRDDVISEVAGNFLTTYYLGQETSAAQAGELARYELIGGGWRNSFEFLNRVREVRARDVQAVANKYMGDRPVGVPAELRSRMCCVRKRATGKSPFFDVITHLCSCVPKARVRASARS